MVPIFETNESARPLIIKILKPFVLKLKKYFNIFLKFSASPPFNKN